MSGISNSSASGHSIHFVIGHSCRPREGQRPCDPRLVGGAALTLARRSAVNAGFAQRCRPEVGAPSREIGVAWHRRCRFRAPARCRSETGAPAVRLAWRSVVGAGFALPRGADRRSALPAVPALLRGRRFAPSRHPSDRGSAFPRRPLLFVGETRAQATPGSTRTPIRRPVWPTAAPAAVIPQK